MNSRNSAVFGENAGSVEEGCGKREEETAEGGLRERNF
jgi:hypothetical protein